VGQLRTFDRLFAESAPLIRQRLYLRESPPVDGGRWPVAVVLRPDQMVARRLEQSMVDAEVYAGPGHFRTGAADSVHFTVRALELYRESVDDRAIRRVCLSPAQGYPRPDPQRRALWHSSGR